MVPRARAVSTDASGTFFCHANLRSDITHEDVAVASGRAASRGLRHVYPTARRRPRPDRSDPQLASREGFGVTATAPKVRTSRRVPHPRAPMSLFRRPAPGARSAGHVRSRHRADGDDPPPQPRSSPRSTPSTRRTCVTPTRPTRTRRAGDVRARRRNAPVFSSPTVALEPPERGSNRLPLCPHHPLHPSPTLLLSRAEDHQGSYLSLISFWSLCRFTSRSSSCNAPSRGVHAHLHHSQLGRPRGD